jgi:hypothetical protein
MSAMAGRADRPCHLEGLHASRVGGDGDGRSGLAEVMADQVLAVEGGELDTLLSGIDISQANSLVPQIYFALPSLKPTLPSSAWTTSLVLWYFSKRASTFVPHSRLPAGFL